MEMTRRWRRALALCLGCLLLSLTVPALGQGGKAQELAEARTRYKKGLELYQEGAFDAALIELQRAYDLAPSYKILYNIGLVDLQLNDYAGALRTFRKYLEEGGKKVDAKRRAEVEKEIEKLQGRVATLSIKTGVSGAEVLVDDQKVGETPLSEPLLVSAGKRKISLSKDGFAPVSRVINVAGGDQKTITLELRSTAEVKAERKKQEQDKPTKERGQEAKEPGRPVPWLLWGITGGLAAGTAVAGVLTLGAEKDLDDERSRPSTKDDLDSAAQKTRTLAIVTDVLLLGTVAVGGYATYKTFFADPPKDARAEKASLGVSIGPGNVAVSGTF